MSYVIRETKVKKTRSPHILNGQNSGHGQHEMLGRVWSRRNSFSLLGETQNGTAALEDSRTFLAKLNVLLP